jgi:hypothetical protein
MNIRLGISKALVPVSLAFAATLFSACATRSACTSGGYTGGPLCIGAVSASVDAGGHSILVSVSVTNVQSATRSGTVWWLLSPPGLEPAWQHDVYQSAVDPVVLRPGETANLQWTEDALIPDGFYALSAWAHVKDANGQFVHSDGKSVPALYIATSANSSSLLRHSAPANGVMIKAARPQTDEGACPSVHLTVTIQNTSDRSETTGFRWELTPIAGSLPRWWEAPVVFSGGQKELTIAPGQVVTEAIDHVLPVELQLNPIDYGVRLSLDTQGKLSDQALVRASWSSSASHDLTIKRAFLPSGPAMIEGIDAPTSFAYRQKSIVSLHLCNLTGETQRVQVWWILGRVADATPWQHPIVVSQTVNATVGPWASVTVAPATSTAAPLGPYELSAWVHYRTPSGKFEHSDGLWLKDPIHLTARASVGG